MFEQEKKAWKAKYEKKIREILANPEQIVAAIASRESVQKKGGPMILESTNKNHELLSAKELPELYQDLDAPHKDSHFEFSRSNKNRIEGTVAKHIKTQNPDIPTSKKFLYDAVHWLAYSHVLLNEGLQITKFNAINDNPDKSEEIADNFRQFEAELQKIAAEILLNELRSPEKSQNNDPEKPAEILLNELRSPEKSQNNDPEKPQNNDPKKSAEILLNELRSQEKSQNNDPEKPQNNDPEKPGFFGRIINAIKNTLTGLANGIKNLLGFGTSENRTMPTKDQPPVSTADPPEIQSISSPGASIPSVSSPPTTPSTSSANKKRPLDQDQRLEVKAKFEELDRKQAAELKSEKGSTVDKTPEARPEVDKSTPKIH